MRPRRKSKKKYMVIAKVGDNDFKKWNCDNLLSFTDFLQRVYPSWRWFNVYLKSNGEQECNYTSRSKPSQKYVTPSEHIRFKNTIKRKRR